MPYTKFKLHTVFVLTKIKKSSLKKNFLGLSLLIITKNVLYISVTLLAAVDNLISDMDIWQMNGRDHWENVVREDQESQEKTCYWILHAFIYECYMSASGKLKAYVSISTCSSLWNCRLLVSIIAQSVCEWIHIGT